MEQDVSPMSETISDAPNNFGIALSLIILRSFLKQTV